MTRYKEWRYDLIPPAKLLVHEYLNDDDLMWVNRHLSLVEDGLQAIRGMQDLPLPPLTRGEVSE